MMREKNSSSIYGKRAERWFVVYVCGLGWSIKLDTLILGPESSSDRTRCQ